MEIRQTKQFKPPRILIHGGGGTGKSTLASLAPDPIFTNIEDGLDEIDAQDFGVCGTFEEIMEQLTWLATNDHKFKTNCIDSLDWCEMLAAKDVCKEYGKKSIAEFDFGKGYELVFTKMERLKNVLSYLHKEKNMCIVIVAHSRVKTYENPMGENYGRYEIKLRDKNSEMFFEWCTMVGFLHPRITVAVEKEGMKKVKKAVGGHEIVLSCLRGAPSYVGKNRYKIKEDIVISEADGWNDLMRAIKGE